MPYTKQSRQAQARRRDTYTPYLPPRWDGQTPKPNRRVRPLGRSGYRGPFRSGGVRRA